MNNTQCVGTIEFLCDRLHGVEKIQSVTQRLMHQMHNHFRIGLGVERITAGFKLVFECLKIFDDTVMHQGQIITGHMRVRIRLRRLAVGSPARVGNAGETLGLCFQDRLFQPGHFSLTTDTADALIVEQGNTGAVITTVFQPF